MTVHSRPAYVVTSTAERWRSAKVLSESDATLSLDGASSFVLREDKGLFLIGECELDELDGHDKIRYSDIPAALLELFAKYGTELFNRIRGDFALLFLNLDTGTITAARDPFGVRPLSWCERNGKIHFSNASAALGTKPNWRALTQYLTRGLDICPETYFDQVFSIVPGHALTFRPGNAVVSTRYHDPSALELPARIGVNDFDFRVRDLFENSVRRRLSRNGKTIVRISGGLDSSAIAGAASRCRTSHPFDVMGYSAAFPGLSSDEAFFQRAVGAHINFPLRRLASRPDLKDLIDPHPDHPGGRGFLATGIAELNLIKATKARMVLCGEGGDALSWDRGLVPEWFKTGKYVRLASALIFASPKERILRLKALHRGSRPPRMKAPWEPSKYPWLIVQPSGNNWSRFEIGHPATSSFANRLASAVRNPQTASVVETVSSYFQENGITVRFPFLDRDLVDFVVSGTSRLERPLGRLDRNLLRRSLGSFLPPAVRRREGKANFLPYFGYQAASRAKEIRELIVSKGFVLQDILDREAALAELASAVADPAVSSRSLDRWSALHRVAAAIAWVTAIKTTAIGANR